MLQWARKEAIKTRAKGFEFDDSSTERRFEAAGFSNKAQKGALVTARRRKYPRKGKPPHAGEKSGFAGEGAYGFGGLNDMSGVKKEVFGDVWEEGVDGDDDDILGEGDADGKEKGPRSREIVRAVKEKIPGQHEDNRPWWSCAEEFPVIRAALEERERLLKEGNNWYCKFEEYGNSIAGETFPKCAPPEWIPKNWMTTEYMNCAYAGWSDRCLRFVLSGDLNVDVKQDEAPCLGALHWASMKGNIITVRRLIAAGVCACA